MTDKRMYRHWQPANAFEWMFGIMAFGFGCFMIIVVFCAYKVVNFFKWLRGKWTK